MPGMLLSHRAERTRTPTCPLQPLEIEAADAFVLDFIYLDEDLAVINKAPGIALLADRSGAPCLWDSLRAEFGKPYIVHRLDKGTSGVLAIARNQATQSRLTKAFQARAVRKFYLAHVTGSVAVRGSGVVELPLRPGRKNRYRVAGPRAGILRKGDRWCLQDAGEGYPSCTRFRVLRNDPAQSRLLLQPTTGRTHQLRVHLSWIGHPVVGDTLYGKPDAPEQRAERLMLHALRLFLPGYPPMTAAPNGL